MARRPHVDGRSTIERLLGRDARERPAAILVERFDPGTARRQFAALRASHLAMLGSSVAVCGSLIAGLLATAALIVFPDHASAQAACSVQNNAYICDLPAGSYSTPQGFDQAASSVGSIQGMGVNSLGDIGLTSSTPSIDPSNFYGLGATASGTYGVFGDIYGVTVDNQGSIAFQPDTTTSLSTYVFGIYAYQSATGTGSTLAGVNVTNAATIDMNLSTVSAPGGAGIWATDQGGSSGGNATGAWVTNSGAITVALAGSEGFAGIQAISLGGGNSGSGHGGTGGETSIVNSATVDVTWIWQGAGSQNNGVYGLQALSQGGNGGSNDEGGGGTGGGAGSASVTLTAGGDVAVAVSGAPPSSSAYSAGVLAAVIGGSGGTGAGADGYSGGFGAGISGAAQISVTDANVTTTGDLLPGLSAIMQAGNGGNGGCQDSDCSESESYGSENGGYGGQVVGEGLITVTAATQPVTISTTGADSAAVQMLLMGGEAGNGGTDTTDFGGTAGGGGGGGAVTGSATVTIGATGQNLVGLTTQGDTSPGIYVLSQGGNGGLGGDASTEFFDITSGGGGSGGAGGTIAISLASVSIATQGAYSPGVYAMSAGGTGAAGGDAQGGIGKTYSGAGGAGGDAGAVTVTLDSASTISTRGDDAAGILAQSFSGAGGNAGGANGGGTHGEGGGAGGNAGAVTVTNDGAIVTGGDTARGILAQSMAGAGGGGGFASGISAHGGTGGSAGTVGAVTVTHDGSISTMGSNAQGVLLQSIGGSGGAGGQAGGNFSSVGGSADDTPFTADGNTVSFTSNGGIVGTSGMAAFGVLGQSIGGGGGDGGGSSGGNVVVGGNGGAGGDGGAVQAQFNAGTQITTVGDAAAGIVMQSIGGGGGNAGNASADALFVSGAVGGQAGGGGAGGTVTVAANGAEIVTAGSKATGVLAQSIGGGGGTGGWALSYAVGP
ncbi:beta strand repeat-containing protein, partial [Mesorhizobium sp. IMUNJ 23232]|uniref:beta strand repeat-containing protein n=1 Tax=Mesorhizobium sp. IMUNJ 23232 TaxID=3376064 RepID=UPI003789DFAE